MSETSSTLVVTGGSGLLGSEIVREWAAWGSSVVIDDDRAGVGAPVPAGTRVLRMSVEQAVNAHPLVAARARAIVHCAAPVGPVHILHGDVLVSMVQSTRAACTLAALGRVPLIVMSSSEVHGTTHVEPDSALSVIDEWSPRQEYQLGKIATEAIARRHEHETKLPVAIVRPWNVTGALQSASKGFVLPRWVDAALAGRPITVYGDGSQERALMDAADFAARIATLALEGPRRWWNQPLHAATPENRTTMLGLARIVQASIESAKGSTVPVQFVDPLTLHGRMFREASAGSKLPPPHPALRGWTPLSKIVDRMIAARGANLPA